MRDINKRIKSEFINYLDYIRIAPKESKSKITAFLHNLLPDIDD